MKLKLHIPILVALLFSFVLFVNVTTPNSMYPFGMLIFYGLLYGIVAMALCITAQLGVLAYVHLYLKGDEGSVSSIERRVADDEKKYLYCICVIAAGIVSMVAANSLGALSVTGGVLVVALTAIACIYLFRRI